AHQRVAELDAIYPERQDVVFGQVALESQREVHLGEFIPDRSFRSSAKATGNLHSEGGSAPNYAPRAHIIDCRREQGPDVDAGMAAEVAILGGDKRFDRQGGDGVEADGQATSV